MPRRARPGRQLAAPLRGSGGEWPALPRGAVGRGDRIPGLPGGDDSVQVPQDRGGDDGLRLGRAELVLLSAGQVLVTGPVDGVGAPGSPDRAPGRQPQPGPSLPGQPGPAGERAGQLLPRGQAGVPVHRAAGGEPPGVAGLGQDRRRAHRRQAGDRGDQCGQAELVQDRRHPPLSLGEPVLGVLPVF